jgi:hypothetical protein
MSLERKIKSALNDNRLLILGTQVLFGFQFDGIFQDMFQELPDLSRMLACGGLSLLMLTVGLLITPSMLHRIVEGGEDSPTLLTATTIFGGLALLPLAIVLAFDIGLAIGHATAPDVGRVVGVIFFITAILCWYALAAAMRRKRNIMPDQVKPTPLPDKIEQLLTEARVIIPGAQALFGFQLAVTLTRAFQQLPAEAKIAHVVAFCCMGLAIILLVAPASLHRISFGGEDDPMFLKVGSIFVIAAPFPLALGIAFDTYVATVRGTGSASLAVALAVIAICTLLGLWYVLPTAWRLARRTSR